MCRGSRGQRVRANDSDLLASVPRHGPLFSATPHIAYLVPGLYRVPGKSEYLEGYSVVITVILIVTPPPPSESKMHTMVETDTQIFCQLLLGHPVLFPTC